MGQKVHPIGFRVGITRRHDSRWFADKKDMPALIKQDHQIRKFIQEKIYLYRVVRSTNRNEHPASRNGPMHPDSLHETIQIFRSGSAICRYGGISCKRTSRQNHNIGQHGIWLYHARVLSNQRFAQFPRNFWISKKKKQQNGRRNQTHPCLFDCNRQYKKQQHQRKRLNQRNNKEFEELSHSFASPKS